MRPIEPIDWTATTCSTNWHPSRDECGELLDEESYVVEVFVDEQWVPIEVVCHECVSRVFSDPIVYSLPGEGRARVSGPYGTDRRIDKEVE